MLSNYDSWKLASPPEAKPCANCGHDAYDHNQDEQGDECVECDCEMYEEGGLPERDPDEAYDRRREERY